MDASVVLGNRSGQRLGTWDARTDVRVGAEQPGLDCETAGNVAGRERKTSAGPATGRLKKLSVRSDLIRTLKLSIAGNWVVSRCTFKPLDGGWVQQRVRRHDAWSEQVQSFGVDFGRLLVHIGLSNGIPETGGIKLNRLQIQAVVAAQLADHPVQRDV